MLSTKEICSYIKSITDASTVKKGETIQRLWSGYGTIDRYLLEDAGTSSIIVKHVFPPSEQRHPRGWSTNNSHQRKLKSYQVEMQWYQHWAAKCTDDCRVPHCLALHGNQQEMLILLEDLDLAGYPRRLQSIDLDTMKKCLAWLANFHARFISVTPVGLWEVGTYWHLATRPDEWSVLGDSTLKAAASEIDQKLTSCPFQTLVHGDAKLANFCFSQDLNKVAAVDFQYVGGGIGMKDVAYFIGSCLREEECHRYEEVLLDSYFSYLKNALQKSTITHAFSFTDLEKTWRQLFPVAWTDFHRFLKGWSPGHWKLNSYSERLSQEVLAQLKT